MAALTLLMVANLPFWMISALSLPVMMEAPLVWLGLVALGFVATGAFADAVAARFGRVGGNLVIEPGGALLDGVRVVGVANWAVEGGWVEIVTQEGPQLRCGAPDEVLEAVKALRDFPGVVCPTENRLDGFEVSCAPRRAHLDVMFSVLWALVAVFVGFAPILALVLVTDAMAVVAATFLVFLAASILAGPAAAVAAQGVGIGSQEPSVTLTLRGSVLHLTSRWTSASVILHDARDQVSFRPDRAGVLMSVEGEPGFELVCTEPFAEVVQDRLGRLVPHEGDVEQVRDALAGVRSALRTE
ncbi:MAG: hypothetical protein R3F61_13160 [Myxococcota bacterium]